MRTRTDVETLREELKNKAFQRFGFSMEVSRELEKDSIRKLKQLSLNAGR